jgi:hypothetical protein
MESYFEQTESNYIGTPSGILHTNKPAKEVEIKDLCYNSGGEPPEGDFKNKYKVVAGDTLVYLEVGKSRNGFSPATHDISFVFNGVWLGLNKN